MKRTSEKNNYMVSKAKLYMLKIVPKLKNKQVVEVTTS